jgi:hypothetical protein
MTLSLLMLMGVVSEAEELKLHSPYRIVSELFVCCCLVE